MTDKTGRLFEEPPFTFGPGFFRDHAGHLITDPRIAVVELIANAYDAGADNVEILWPSEAGGQFSVSDNGTGMTKDEFLRRWKTLSYNRTREQGEFVQYPPDITSPRERRVAFGQSGKGRHSAFCFSDSYELSTGKDGAETKATVTLEADGKEPFRCTVVGTTDSNRHGTTITAFISRNYISLDDISQAIGSKFLVAPWFGIKVNDAYLTLQDLQGLGSDELDVPPFGNVKIHTIDAEVQDRTTRLRGITWWVNRKLVGQHSWGGLDEHGAILDGRTQLAKRCSFIVEADVLREDVKDDWTGFRDTPKSLAVNAAVKTFVARALDNMLSKQRRQRRTEALQENRELLRVLPKQSRRLASDFAESVLKSCPTLTQGDLVRTVRIYANMERARSGYELLERLAACSPEDIDTWNTLMRDWTASNADIVLTEIGRRLSVVNELQALVKKGCGDELHEFQPLFAKGLWMFGPEYESVDFTSNRTMTTVLSKLFTKDVNETDSSRPDFVALPDRSIGAYSADSYDDNGEVSGVRKVLVVELKKGNSELGTDDIRQGEDYAAAIRKAGVVQSTTEFRVLVLGKSIAEDAIEERRVGNTIMVSARCYDAVLRQAHARTFNLQKKLEQVPAQASGEEDAEDTFGESLFDDERIGPDVSQ